tara:strand:- start:209 stop:490 length:282 start_codon:yes stop_codon:yes gene_type:complete
MTYLHNDDELSLAIGACSWDNATLLNELHDKLNEIQILNKVWNQDERCLNVDNDKELRAWRNVTSIRYRGDLVNLTVELTVRESDILRDEQTA